MYDIHMHLDPFNTIINDDSEYITMTFNINTWKKKIVYVYITHSCSIFYIPKQSSNIIQESLKHCPIIIMGDFNVTF